MRKGEADEEEEEQQKEEEKLGLFFFLERRLLRGRFAVAILFISCFALAFSMPYSVIRVPAVGGEDLAHDFICLEMFLSSLLHRYHYYGLL